MKITDCFHLSALRSVLMQSSSPLIPFPLMLFRQPESFGAPPESRWRARNAAVQSHQDGLRLSQPRTHRHGHVQGQRLLVVDRLWELFEELF